MSTLALTKSSGNEVTSSMNATPKAAKVVLNELEAMRKKLKLQNRNPSISLEGEAKNGSSIM